MTYDLEAEPVQELSVADAKATFSNLIDRVAAGERFLVRKRGRPALGLVPPRELAAQAARPAGLLSIAGLLADWGDDVDEMIEEIYAGRERSADRPAPDLGSDDGDLHRPPVQH